MTDQIVMYGLGGVEYKFKCLRFEVFEANEVRFSDIQYEAGRMIERNPSIEHVYVMSNRRGLAWEYIQSVKKDSIESCAIFRDTLEREAVKFI